MNNAANIIKPIRIATVEQLLTHAHAMESEAAERYEELADQMEVHNNIELATLFRKLAAIELKHVHAVDAMCDGLELPELKAWDYQWEFESPEALDSSNAHYLMRPYHAIKLALHHEKLAVKFFEDVIANNNDPDLTQAAHKLANDEREHVGLLEDLLKSLPVPEKNWDEDMDPPRLQE